jgi:DNA processing protein
VKRLERILISTKTNLRNDDLELIFNNYNTLNSLINNKARIPFKINLDDSEIDLSRLDSCLLRDDLKALEYTDEDYPELLREIPDPPRFIFVKGDCSCLYDNTLKLAVVGSRKSTNYGKFVIDLLIPKLVKNEVCIVSGLAFGIDGLAHKKAIEYDGKVIAVMGCGVDHIYPKSNATLYKKVLNNGCVISEYLPWEKPRNYYFPQRNRIISGLSKGVLVVEAASKSGSLITARCAIEQNRDVFAVPGPVNAYLSQGTNKLIQIGAKLVLKTEDILNEFPLYQKKNTELNTEKIINELSDEEKVIFQIIKDGGSTFDVILDRSGLDASSLNYNLTILTLKGVIDVVGTQYECKF